MMHVHPLADDLDAVCSRIGEAWQLLSGERVFITGGTGFVGTWLLETLAWANRRFALNAQAVVLSRRPEEFFRKAPHLANDLMFSWQQGDVRDFAVPEGKFNAVIHAAFDSAAPVGALDAGQMVDTIVGGMRHVLAAARRMQTERFLFVSSGAVYGRQPPELERLSETDGGAPDIASPSPGAVYGESKRLAELLTMDAANTFLPHAAIARCFAFVGPYLPLDRHFAVGNFLGNLLRGEPLRVNGDGTPWRSYLYAADLAEWLWTMLLRAPSKCVLNVGSEEAVQIRNLAEAIASLNQPALPVTIAKQADPDRLAERYVPDCTEARMRLGLENRTPLLVALRKTAAWHAQNA
ncbi:MAG: epimerase [Pirellula sp.]|nr:epimerase [Pirellula sp.]